MKTVLVWLVLVFLILSVYLGYQLLVGRQSVTEGASEGAVAAERRHLKEESPQKMVLSPLLREEMARFYQAGNLLSSSVAGGVSFVNFNNQALTVKAKAASILKLLPEVTAVQL